jgi:hypothetical protein
MHAKSMKRNIGSADKALRLFFAPVLFVLYYTRVVGGLLGFAVLVLSVYFLLSAIISFCIIYNVLGLTSAPKEK